MWFSDASREEKGAAPGSTQGRLGMQPLTAATIRSRHHPQPLTATTFRSRQRPDRPCSTVQAPGGVQTPVSSHS